MFSREAFLIYKSFYPAISDLTDEQLGRLFRSLFVYQIEGTDCHDSDIVMAFRFFKNQFRLDDTKYEKVVNRNKSNGSKGGRPKTHNNPKNPVGFQEPKKPDNDKDNVNDKEKDNDEELTLFEQALVEFKKMRTKIKKPMTDRAVELLLADLESLAPNNEPLKIQILNQSIMKCWQGVFPIKNTEIEYSQPKYNKD